MKRLFSIFALALCMLSLLPVPAWAADDASYTIFYEDGSYAIVEFATESYARYVADEQVTYTYHNALGQRCFAYILRGVFTYNGVTSRADSVDYKAEIYRQGWDISTHSEYVSGNTAYGRATFTGPNGESRAVSLTLTCDKNGTIT